MPGSLTSVRQAVHGAKNESCTIVDPYSLTDCLILLEKR